MSQIKPIRALRDNYIWVIHGVDQSRIVILDPGEAEPVLRYLKENNLKLDGILLTHHHWDHTNGVDRLLAYFPGIPVYSSEKDKVPGVNHFVKEGDEITFSNLSSPIRVMEIPGHTLGHLGFVYEKALFSGDTLFSCGCGRIFEGTPEQMYQSLEKLKQLPSDTLMYCAHEYTRSNIRFAEAVDPANQILQQWKQEVEDLREKNIPSLPVSLKTELQTNPFLRCEDPIILASVKKNGYAGEGDPTSVMLHLREWKNQFDKAST
jgi:hydroxyacylglutathione hydrolase